VKPFRFKLQAVLILRQRAEQGALEQHARALQVRQQAADALARTDRQIADLWNSIRQVLVQGAPASELSRLDQYSHGLEAQRRSIESALREAGRKVETAVLKLLAARRDREAVERHCANQRRRHEWEQSRIEQKLLDDLVSQRAAARANNAGAQSHRWN
jgi:flagellar export protein FliJ